MTQDTDRTLGALRTLEDEYANQQRQLKQEAEGRMSAADLSPSDWLAIQCAVSNDSDLSNEQRLRLVNALGDFYASATEGMSLGDLYTIRTV